MLTWMDHVEERSQDVKQRLQGKLQRARQKSEKRSLKLFLTQLENELIYGIDSVIPLKHVSSCAGRLRKPSLASRARHV